MFDFGHNEGYYFDTTSPIASTWNHCIENGRRLNILERVCTALICQPCPLLLTLSPLIIELQTHLHQIRLDQEVCRQGFRLLQTKTAVTEIFILHCFNTSVNLWLETRSRGANVKIFLTLDMGSVATNACVLIGTCQIDCDCNMATELLWHRKWWVLYPLCALVAPQNYKYTRKHPIRMHTARLDTVRASVSPPDVVPKRTPRSDFKGEGSTLPCDLSHGIFDITYPLPVAYELTDACENIIFP